MFLSVIYCGIFQLLCRVALSNTFVVKPNETGRYIWWNHNQNLQFFCTYCRRHILEDYNNNGQYHEEQCYKNNNGQLTETERNNNLLPYCNKLGGEVPNCGAVPVIDGGSWICLAGVSNDSVFVYTTCTLQCNLPNQLDNNKLEPITIRCNESLMFDEDVSKVTCSEDRVSTSTIEITTQTILNQKGCELPQNFSDEPWQCDKSPLVKEQLSEIGTICWLYCPNDKKNTSVVCQENNLHGNWNNTISNIVCNNVSKERFNPQQPAVNLTVVIVLSTVLSAVIIAVVVVFLLCYFSRKKPTSTALSSSEETEKFLQESPQTGTHGNTCIEMKSSENSSATYSASTSASNSSVNSMEVSETSSTLEVAEEIPTVGTSKNSVNEPMDEQFKTREEESDVSSPKGEPEIINLPENQTEKSVINVEHLYTGSLGENKLNECNLSSLSDIPSGKNDNKNNPDVLNLNSHDLDKMVDDWENDSLTHGLNNYDISKDDKKLQCNKSIPENLKSFEIKPKIAEKNHLIICEIGQEFQICVTATGDPKPDFTWTLNTLDGRSKDVTSTCTCTTNSIIMESKAGNTTRLKQLLKCKKATLEDMGAYKVSVSNKHGSITAVYFVCQLDLCLQCDFPIEDIESGPYIFVKELADYIEPLDAISDAKSWKGLARWIGVGSQAIKNRQYHTKGEIGKATEDIIQGLRQRGYKLAHLIYYFSLKDSLYIEVLKLIQTHFSDHCEKCSICFNLLVIEKLSESSKQDTHINI